MDDKPSSRPSSLTVLQTTRERLAQLTQAEPPPFLPERPRDMDYVHQAIFELLGRICHSFYELDETLLEHLKQKVRTLLADGELRSSDCWGLKGCYLLELMLSGKDDSLPIAAEKEEESKRCPWNSYGLTSEGVRKHYLEARTLHETRHS